MQILVRMLIMGVVNTGLKLTDLLWGIDRQDQIIETGGSGDEKRC
jgi:hypothetical protein